MNNLDRLPGDGLVSGDRRPDESGHVMVATLVTAVLVGGLVFASGSISKVELDAARGRLDRLRAQYVAQAGIERGMWFLRDAVTKTAVLDPIGSLRRLFSEAGGGARTVVPWVGESLRSGAETLGQYTVSMDAIVGDDSVQVRIRATGYYPEAPRNRSAGDKHSVHCALETMVRIALEPARVFNYSYFINNWGWFYGTPIFCNGNARSNGQFDAAGYAPMITGQPTYDRLNWSGANAQLVGYQDDNKDGLSDGNDGGLFSGWDIVGAQNVRGNGGRAANQHEFEERLPMPNLTELGPYEARAQSLGANIKIGGVVVCDGVQGDEAGEPRNLYLVGTAAAPIELNGPVVVRGHAIITGVVRGKGAIYSGGNIYIPNNVTYQNPPSTPRPTDNSQATTEAWLTANRDKDYLGLFAREHIAAGDHTDSTWRNYVDGWMQNSMNRSDEDAGEDLIPNTRKGKDGIASTADDDVLEGDGRFTTEVYTERDRLLGLIPEGRNVGDPVPGTGEDIDGDGRRDAGTRVTNVDFGTPLDRANWGGNMPAAGVTYSSIASNRMTQIDAVVYTNQSFSWLTLGGDAKMNGSLVCRNENIVFSGQITMNYDCRLLGGGSGLFGSMLPRAVESVQVRGWRKLDFDPHKESSVNL